MPLQATSGAASYDAFGGGAAAVPTFVEDVFSPYLYAGSSSNKTIVNGINLSEKGGLVWMKSRIDYTTTGYNHTLYDTARGNLSRLSSNTTSAADTGSGSTYMSSFNNNGFTLVGNGFYENYSPDMVSWTFRKQPKFFDVVTWTGTGVNRTISHNLGSVPGSIIVKRTDASQDWAVYHRSLANTQYLVLNSTASAATDATWWNSTTPTSTVFSVGTDASVNASGGTYVAYLFAHDAGGFGLTGTDNVISCGSFTTDSNYDASATLGYEPQWILYKKSSGEGNWVIADNMRGWNNTDISRLFPDSSSAETSYTASAPNSPTATGFISTGLLSASSTYIYIAIRRGPMKVPTDATKVFLPFKETTSTNPQTITTGFPVDLAIATVTTGTNRQVSDRLRGGSTSSFTYLLTDSTAAEVTYSGFGFGFDNNTGIVDSSVLVQPNGMIWNFRRAPSFFDEVCYTGTSSNTTQAHNLGAAPELYIVKGRSLANTNWVVGSTAYSASSILTMQTVGGLQSAPSQFNSTYPTASVFSLGTGASTNNSGTTYVAYLFATLAGISKVGSYTGNGTTQTIDCGFTGGARFVLIKKTSGTGDWMVSDSARGIIAGNDPYLELNNTNAEVTGEDWLDTDSTGFVVNEVSGSNANTSSATYIFLAIA